MLRDSQRGQGLQNDEPNVPFFLDREILRDDERRIGNETRIDIGKRIDSEVMAEQ